MLGFWGSAQQLETRTLSSCPRVKESKKCIASPELHVRTRYNSLLCFCVHSDPYVKIWLMHDGKKMEKKKTPIKEKNLNPIFEETFMFTVPYERIRQTSLVISVMDYDRLGRNEAIGQLVLGSKSGPMEVKHWNEMFAESD